MGTRPLWHPGQCHASFELLRALGFVVVPTLALQRPRWRLSEIKGVGVTVAVSDVCSPSSTKGSPPGALLSSELAILAQAGSFLGDVSPRI